jgi:hypothetical protein
LVTARHSLILTSSDCRLETKSISHLCGNKKEHGSAPVSAEGQTFVRACDIAGEMDFCQKVKASMGLAA